MCAVLVAAGCANAARRPSAHAGAQRTHPAHHARVSRSAPAERAVTRAAGHPIVVGVGNVPGCLAGSPAGLPILRAYRASVLRVIIDPRHGAGGQAVPCVAAAVRAGYRVHIVIGYFNTWSRSRIVGYVRQVLASYGRYAWAVSIGNEQELNQGGSKETGAQYAAVWRATEPVLAAAAPRAIRVVGEVSPWGINFLHTAFTAGLPRAQAIAAHAYATHYGFTLSSVVAWAHAQHLPLWITEGLTGPGAWPPSTSRLHSVALSQLSGVAVADAWLG